MTNIYLCLKIIDFVMSSTLLNLRDKYYQYEAEGFEIKWLAIGGYKSDFWHI